MQFEKIIIEGANQTGKDTLKDILNKETNYNYVIYTRGIISNYILDRIFLRKNNIYYNKNFDEMAEYIKNDKKTLYIILYYSQGINATKTESKVFIEKENELFLEFAHKILYQKQIIKNVMLINRDMPTQTKLMLINYKLKGENIWKK